MKDSKFNEKNLTKINDFDTSTLNNLAQIEQNLKTLYNSQSSCCKIKFGRC